MTVVDLNPITAIAPFPRTEDEATPDKLAAHFTVLAYMAGRVALTHPDAQVRGQAHRDVGLYYTLAYLMRTLAANAAWPATVAARAIREELEDGTHIEVDLTGWLREYKIQPDIIDLAARHMVTEAAIGRAETDDLRAEIARLQDALADAQGSADREDTLTREIADLKAQRDALKADCDLLTGTAREQMAAAIGWDALNREVDRVIGAGSAGAVTIDRVVDEVMAAFRKAVQP